MLHMFALFLFFISPLCMHRIIPTTHPPSFSISLALQLQRRAQPPVEIRRFVDRFVDGFCAEYSILSSALRAVAALLFARVVFPRLLLLRCVRFDAGEEREALANDVRLQTQLKWMRRLTPLELGVNPLVRVSG